MIIKVGGYQGSYRVLSLAFNKDVKMDLLKNQLDFLYITDEEAVLYPENIIVSEDRDVIEKLHRAGNYDVYELTENGKLIEYYNDKSIDNYFFITAKCNSNCIMCPSPDNSRKNGGSSSIENLIEVAKHIPADTPHLTITGGEPFMVEEKLFKFILFLKEKFENTEFLFLTNGRIFALDSYVKQLKACIPENSVIGIPIHGSTAEIHDGITQTVNSFYQTISGVKKLLRENLKIEIRIVISKLNAEDIVNIAKMIVESMQGISHVSIIAMEMTGSAYVHREKVWIPYKQVAKALEEGVFLLLKNGIDVKLYNFPLCTVKKEFWTLCEQSISPNKVRYADECEKCRMKSICGGVFAGTISMERGELEAIV